MNLPVVKFAHYLNFTKCLIITNFKYNSYITILDNNEFNFIITMRIYQIMCTNN